MTDDKIVEAMARAICKARGVDPDYCAYGVASTKGDYTCRVTFWQTHIADARAALSVARPMIEAQRWLPSLTPPTTGENENG